MVGWRHDVGSDGRKRRVTMDVRRTHRYDLTTTWTGNRGTGTSGYRDYGRDHEVSADGRPAIAGSADPVFRGEATRWNPELELLAALSQCHMLSYLHVCVTAGVVVTAYEDAPYGLMAETADGGGHFTEVVLRPSVTVADAGMADKAQRLHAEASGKCFIASSVNFPVRHEPSVEIQSLQP
jgi:organic hydroperoxide reductase OsmC/OhrA